MSSAPARLPVTCLPVVPKSSEDLINLAVAIQVPPGRFTNFTAAAVAPEVQSAIVISQNATQAVVTLAAYPGQVLRGPKQVANVCFTLLEPQPSDFLRLEVVSIRGQRADNGSPVGNTAGLPGRATVVGQEPLLEAMRSAGGQPELILYAPPGTAHQIESKPTLDNNPQSWQPAWQVQLPTNSLSQTISVTLTNRTLFYRAVRE